MRWLMPGWSRSCGTHHSASPAWLPEGRRTTVNALLLRSSLAMAGGPEESMTPGVTLHQPVGVHETYLPYEAQRCGGHKRPL